MQDFLTNPMFYVIAILCAINFFGMWLIVPSRRPIDTRGYGLLFTADQPRDNYRRLHNYQKRCKQAYAIAWERFKKAATSDRATMWEFSGSWADKTIDVVLHGYAYRYHRGTEFLNNLRSK